MNDIVPLVDLAAQHASLHPALDAAIQRVLASGRFILDAEVAAFERAFAEYLGIGHAVGVSSGTAALQLALLAVGIGVGDEVITVSHTAVATIAAIVGTGAVPVFVDIEATHYTLDPGRIAAAITPRTRAIVPVHLYGCPADLAPILAVAQEHGLRVIEDCAQAHGARYRGRPVGAWGDLGAFSFYPTKNLGALGDAGAVVTADPELAARVAGLRQYGWGRRHVSDIHGLNARLDEFQAAVLAVKLDHLDAWNTRRRVLALRYQAALAETGLGLPTEPTETTHVFHQFVVHTARRDDLADHLRRLRISTAVLYPVPVHLQPAYRQAARRAADLDCTEQAAACVLSLPLYPELTDAQHARVCDAVLAWRG